MARNFTEGWIEFLSKRAAKEVAANLNSAQVFITVIHLNGLYLNYYYKMGFVSIV